MLEIPAFAPTNNGLTFESPAFVSPYGQYGGQFTFSLVLGWLFVPLLTTLFVLFKEWQEKHEFLEYEVSYNVVS